MNRETALKVRNATPYPEQPAAGATDCEHRGTDRLCSCHLTLEQHGAAEELGDYTLYLFGRPYRGRIKVPYYPSGGIGLESARTPTQRVAKAATSEPIKRTRAPRKRHVATVAPAAGPIHVDAAPPTRASVAPRKFDPVYNSAYARARRQGPAAVAAFKAEWAARKAAA